MKFLVGVIIVVGVIGLVFGLAYAFKDDKD